MMDLLLATSGGESQSASGGYVDDVFSAYVRTGTGADVTVNTNIDMTKGYMLWTKGRSGATDHAIYDSARGVTFDLASNLTSAQTTQSTGLKSVSGTGHTIGSLAKMNTNTATYVDWVFRKAPKFFDVVTYTGNGTSNRQIPHNLGCEVGFAVVKRTNIASHWLAQHRSVDLTGNKTLYLSLTSALGVGNNNWNSTHATSTHLILGDHEDVNTAGNTYVAYLFAHDPSAEGIIQCGSFTTDGSGNATVNLGWEPQYLMMKSSSSAGGWLIYDSMRGMSYASNGDARLQANLTNAEVADDTINSSSTGFVVQAGGSVPTASTIIYLAIRRPNKPPTSGTQVYNAITRTGTGAAATVTGVGFAPDMTITKKRSSATLTGARFVDRLRGATRWLESSATTVETVTADTVTGLDNMDGFVLGADATTSAFNTNTHTYINHFFKRAKGFFDVVCDTGTSAAHVIAHGLSVAPEFIIRKSRSGATQWEVWHSALAATEKLVLNSVAVKATDAAAWNSTLPTATQFTVGTGANVNANAATFVTYLFATLTGISKVGSYTGNGTSQTINCGFSTGSRFILVKRTDATGDWYVWDSVRGIIAANDPHLSLNTAAAEVTTDDSVDPEASGFIVNQNTTTNINVNGGQYIFLAIA